MKFKLAELFKPFFFFLFSILFIPWTLFSQVQQSKYITLHVKFKEHSKPTSDVSSRTSKVGIERVDRISERHGAISIRRIFPEAGVFEEAHKAFGLHLWHEIKFKKDIKLKDAIDDYRGTDYFEKVEESRPYSFVSESTVTKDLTKLSSAPNDPYFSNQWHFENYGQTDGTAGADINLLKAWQIETGSPNVIVAVIDGGIDVNHVDLKEALWVNSGEIPANGRDDDRNGYIDDVHGYGFGDQSPVLYPDNHATHVAGTIGAISNNGIGVSGIAGGNGVERGVRLMSCAAFGNFKSGGFEEAMVYAADNGAVISQNSWGGGSSSIEAAINYFISRAGYDNSAANFAKNIQTGPMAGGIVIFAAGNSNTSDTYYAYPAPLEKVIAVASTDHQDVKSRFSNYGSWVDIFAPGSEVYSTIAYGYDYFSGTSMACPHVSGVAALIISNLQRTGLKPSEIWNRLRLSSRSINSMNPNLVGELGWGRLDAFVALKEPDNVPPGPITDIRVEAVHSTSVLLKWTASGENDYEGQAAEYEIRYSTSPIDESNFTLATRVSTPPIPPPAGEQVAFEINDLVSFTTYYFAIKSTDVFNNISALSTLVSARTLRLPTPEFVTTKLSEQLYTGGSSVKSVVIKNAGDEQELYVRAGVPQLEPAPVTPPLGATGRLFAINSSRNTIEELNPKTGLIVNAIPMPEPSTKTKEGLAFDGKYLYYGRSKKIYKMNAETGIVIRTINLDDALAIHGLVWSGRYLYVSIKGTYTSNVYEVDTDNGSVQRTLGVDSEMAYFGANNSLLLVGNGQLEEVSIESGNYIKGIPVGLNPKCIVFSSIDNLIFVSGTFNDLIMAIRPSDGEVMYTFPYPTTTALAGLEHKFGWLETSEQVVVIPPGQTSEVPIKFISSGLNTGTWTGSVNIIPINSNTNPLQIPVNLEVLSGTDIETAQEIDFGIAYMGFTIDTTIVIENRGFTELVIDQIQSSDHRVENSISSVTLSPGQKVDMVVRFEPDGTGIIDARIIFNSNDPDEGALSIPVKAHVLEAPAVVITPDSLKATLNSGETTSLTFVVKNVGSSTFQWNANLSGYELDDFLKSTVSQNDYSIQKDSAYKNELGIISLRASAPEPITCLSYDPDGELLYAKSFSGNNFYSYNPVLDQWINVGLAPSDFYGQAIYLNGKIYHGGTRLNIYTTQSNSWTSVSFPVTGKAVSLTTDDKYIYVAIERGLFRFDPVSQSWLELAPVPAPIYMTGFGALSYHSGIIYANGTQPIEGDGNTLFFKYFVDSNVWIKSNSISGKASMGGAIDISSARYFVIGSPNRLPGTRIQMSILDIKEGEWSRIATPFSFGSTTSLVFVGKEGSSGIYYTQGEEGGKLGYYETASAPNWFEITPSNGSLSAGESQTISVNLNAQGLFGATYRSNIRVFNAHPRIEKVVPLELKVLGVPDFFLSEVSADVGEVIVGYEGGTVLNIKNKGTSDLVVNGISLSSSDFKISDSYTDLPISSFSIPVGESKSVFAHFNPSSIGEQTGTFTFHSNDPDNSNIQFILKGTGVHPALLQVPADTIRFTLFTGERAKQKFSIINTGNGSTQYLTVWGVEPWIEIDSAGYPVNIGPHQTREFEAIITAKGFSQGRHMGSIHIEDHRDPSFTSYLLPVILDVISAPDLYVSSDSLDYSDQFVHGRYDSTIQIRNDGVLPLLISSIKSNNPAFTISVSAPLNLEPGASVYATVHFNPNSLGLQEGSITINSNDPDQNLFVIKIKGAGVNPPRLLSNDTELFLEVYAGESQSESIDLSNGGGSILKWKIINEYDNQQSTGGIFSAKANAPEVAVGFPAKLVGLTSDPSNGMLYAQYLWSQYLYAFDPQSNIWTEVGNTPTVYSYKNAGAVILNSKMYCTYAEDPSRIYIYDMILKDWTTKTNQLGFGTATITTDGTLLYLAGGGRFASYDPKKQIWKNLAIPNFSLDGLGGLSYLNGEIYAHASGSNGFSRYTIASNVWENLIPLPDKATHGSTIDPIKKRYYAYWKNYLYEYDIAANVWTVLYLSFFEVGDSGGLSYSSRAAQEGIYFTQGDTGKGFARYEPTNDLAWLRSSQLVGEVKAMDTQHIGVNCNAGNLSPGVYHGKIKVSSNDPDNMNFDIPVTFHVKSRSPGIQIPSLLSDTVSRSIQTTNFIVIENVGKEPLEWNLASALPAWLSLNKTSGSIPGQSIDIVEVIFHPGLFTFGGMADYTLEINSNDPSVSKSFTRILLTIQNQQPFLTAAIPNQILDSDQIEIQLSEYFADPDSDPLDFSVSASESSLISAEVVNSTLLQISPLKSGLLTVSVAATDIYNSSVTTTFEVNNLVTGIEPDHDPPGIIASPNPFENIVSVQVTGYQIGKTTFELFDLTGKAVWKSDEIDISSLSEIEFDGRNLPSGLYTFILSIDNRVIDSIRLMKK